MKLLTTLFMIIFILLSSLQGSSAITTNYFKYLDFYGKAYPSKEITIPFLLSRKVFKGISESEFMNKIQRSYFYYIPKPHSKLTNRDIGCFKQIINKKKRTIIYYQIESKFRIKLSFNKRKKIIKKTTS